MTCGQLDIPENSRLRNPYVSAIKKKGGLQLLRSCKDPLCCMSQKEQQVFQL